jgi:hypothetical protein
MADVPELTLRDWFAGMALNALLSQTQQGGPPVGGHVSIKSLEPWAKRAYDLAELMLLERERKRSTLNLQAPPP